MQLKKTFGTTLVLTGAVLMLTVPAMAGNGKSTSAGQGTRSQDRLKDGSCREAIENNHGLLQLAGKGKGHGYGPGDGTGTKSRPMDGTGYGPGSKVIEAPGNLDSGYQLAGNGNGGTGDNEGFGPGDGTGDGICDNG